MHRIATLIAFLSLVAHEVQGCCAHHAHADVLSSTQSLRPGRCCERGEPGLGGAELACSSLNAHGTATGCDRQGDQHRGECHESPCVYMAPNSDSGGGNDLCCDAALPAFVADTSFLAKPSVATDFPRNELLLAPRSHFLNQTLLL